MSDLGGTAAVSTLGFSADSVSYLLWSPSSLSVRRARRLRFPSSTSLKHWISRVPDDGLSSNVEFFIGYLKCLEGIIRIILTPSVVAGLRASGRRRTPPSPPFLRALLCLVHV